MYNKLFEKETASKVNKNLITEFLLEMYLIKNFIKSIKVYDDMLKQTSLNYASLLKDLMPSIEHF